ncbi:MAG TPA: ankyrin repeat domain-containing protein [Fimbriimonadaceae bacterium]|nr:ankyrin repeat domain-containing protein [Fimbriimonadaceae bacterium]
MLDEVGSGKSTKSLLVLIVIVAMAFWGGMKFEAAKHWSETQLPFASVEEFLAAIDKTKSTERWFGPYARLRRQGAGLLPPLKDGQGLPLLSRLIKDNRLQELKFVMALDSYPVMARDPKGWTPLHYATQQKNSLAYLTALGPVLMDWSEHKDKKGRTALHLAAAKDDMLAVRQLLTTGVTFDYELQENSGDTALHIAIRASEEASLGTILALARSRDSFGPDALGRTPLLLAVELEKWAAVRVLSEEGDDPNQPDQKGRTARSLLKVRNPDLYREVVPTWRRFGFATDSDQTGRTPR